MSRKWGTPEWVAKARAALGQWQDPLFRLSVVTRSHISAGHSIMARQCARALAHEAFQRDPSLREPRDAG